MQLDKNAAIIMKRITEKQRELNIIGRAIELGFEFETELAYYQVLERSEEYLYNNVDADKYEYCHLHTGAGGQNYTYGDGMGYENTVSGNIYDFWAKDSRYIFDEKGIPSEVEWFNVEEGDGSVVFFDRQIDSEGNVIQLYC